MKFLKSINTVNTVAIQDTSMEKGILIVDDSKFSRNILKDILKNEGFNVIAEAKNGLEAIELTKQKKPKYIFMDVEMPMLDGIGAIPRILEVDPSVHIIMCTAMGQKNIIVEAARSGAKDYVLKPYKKENIIRVLSALKETHQKVDFVKEKLETIAEKNYPKDLAEEVLEATEEEKLYILAEEDNPEDFINEREPDITGYEENIEALEEENESILSIQEESMEALDEENEPILSIQEDMEALEEEKEPEVSIQEESIEGLEEENEPILSIHEESMQSLEEENEPILSIQEECMEASEEEKEPEVSIQEECMEASEEENEPKVSIQEESMQPLIQEESMQPLEEENEPLLSIQEESMQPLEEENEPMVSIQEESMEVLEEENEPEVSIQEESIEGLEEENEPEVSIQEESIEGLEEENEPEVSIQEESIEGLEEENEPEVSIQEESIEGLEEENEPIVSVQEENREALSDNCDFTYLWENRFNLRQEGSFALNLVNQRISFYKVAYLTSDGYGLSERNSSDKEIMSGMICSYLRLGNRLQSEEPIYEYQKCASPKGNRMFSNKILEEECKDMTDITMADILMLACNKEQQSTKIFLKKSCLSYAILHLVQGKADRILGQVSVNYRKA